MSDPLTRWRVMEAEAAELEARGRRALFLFDILNLPADHILSKYLRGEVSWVDVMRSLPGRVLQLQSRKMTLGQAIVNACQGPSDHVNAWVERIHHRSDEDMATALDLYLSELDESGRHGGGDLSYGETLSKMNDTYKIYRVPSVRLANPKDAEKFRKTISDKEDE